MHYVPYNAPLDLDEIRDVDLRKSIFRAMAKELLRSAPVDKAASVARLMEKAFKAGFDLARTDQAATTTDRLLRKMTEMDLPSLSRNHLSKLRLMVFGSSGWDLPPGGDPGAGDPGRVFYLWIVPNVVFPAGRWRAVEEDLDIYDTSEKTLGPFIKLGLMKEFMSNGNRFCFLTEYGYELLRTGETSLPDEQNGVAPPIAHDYHRMMQKSVDEFPARSKAREERRRKDQDNKERAEQERLNKKEQKLRAPELRVASVGGEKKALRVLEIIDDGYACSKLGTQIVKDLEAVGINISYRSLPKLRSDLIEGLARHGIHYTAPRRPAPHPPQGSYIPRSPSWPGSSFGMGPGAAAGFGSEITQSAPRDPLRPPNYEGLRTYKPDETVLSELGIRSVQEMVGHINQARIKSGQFPISQGDYPGSKASFEKLAREFRSLSRNDDD